MSEDNKTESRGLYYVIPSEIMDSHELEPIAKLLYALLSGLAHRDGTCFPSNEYLANRIGKDKRQVIRILDSLEKLDLISKRIEPDKNNPFIKKRIITVHLSFKKCLRSDTHVTSESDTHVTSGVTPMSPIVSEEIHIESKERETRARTPAPPPLLFSFGVHVKLKEGEYDKLSERFGKGDLDDMIDTINNKISNGNTKPGKDYAAMIREWFKIQKKNGWDAQNPKKTTETAQKSTINKNMAWAEEKQRELHKTGINDLRIDYRSVTVGNDSVGFEEDNFQARVDSLLRYEADRAREAKNKEEERKRKTKEGVRKLGANCLKFLEDRKINFDPDWCGMNYQGHYETFSWDNLSTIKDALLKFGVEERDLPEVLKLK